MTPNHCSIDDSSPPKKSTFSCGARQSVSFCPQTRSLPDDLCRSASSFNMPDNMRCPARDASRSTRQAAGSGLLSVYSIRVRLRHPDDGSDEDYRLPVRCQFELLVLCHAHDLGLAGKTGSGTENRNGPKGASHFRYLTPFSGTNVDGKMRLPSRRSTDSVMFLWTQTAEP
jgi:hypothetical protein